MSNLSNASLDELRAELARRTAQESGELELVRVPLDVDRYSDFVNSVDRMMQEDVDNGHLDEDTPHYVYEEAMKLVYGDRAFDIINKIFR